MSRRRAVLCASSLGLSSVAAVSAALGQEVAANIADSQTVETVTVTDRRLTLNLVPEKVLDTPQSIDVISAQVIKEQGVANLQDALKNVPGITLNAGEGGTHGDLVNLRGFSAGGDSVNAVASFRRAAEGGDPDGHDMLGRCHENGWGTAKDYVKAVHHYRIAAEAGLDWALYNLGHMLLNGSGVTREPAAAFACYAKAAAKGHVRAMNLLGRCHEEGWGIAPDRARARAWYRRSAFGGYFRGAYNYADMIAAEGGIHSAACWFRCALAGAPQATREVMLRALSMRPEPPLRNLAAEFS